MSMRSILAAFVVMALLAVAASAHSDPVVSGPVPGTGVVPSFPTRDHLNQHFEPLWRVRENHFPELSRPQTPIVIVPGPGYCGRCYRQYTGHRCPNGCLGHSMHGRGSSTSIVINNRSTGAHFSYTVNSGSSYGSGRANGECLCRFFGFEPLPGCGPKRCMR